MKNSNQHIQPACLPVTRHDLDGIFIHQNDSFHKYLYRDLLYVKACGCYCDLYFRNQKRITVAFPLGVVTHRLPADLFVRIHHSHVVSLYDIDLWADSSVRIGEEWLPIGHRYRKDFLCRLNILTTSCKAASNVASETNNI